MPARSVSGWRGADRSAADVVRILVTGSSGHLGEALVRVWHTATLTVGAEGHHAETSGSYA